MKAIFYLSNDLFDRAHRVWARHLSRRSAAVALILVYLLSLNWVYNKFGTTIAKAD